MLSSIDKKLYYYFGLEEIISSLPLRILYLFFIGNLAHFLYHMSERVGYTQFLSYCHAYFPQCHYYQNLYFLNDYLYLKGVFYAFCLIFLTLACILFIKKMYGLSHLFTILLSFFSIIPSYLLLGEFNELIQHEYHYLFFVTLIFILVRKGRFEFLMIFYAIVYLFAGLSKMISIDWLIGHLTVPYLNTEYLFVLTILLTLFQLISPYFLLFGGKYTRYIAVLLSEAFHIFTSALPLVSYSFIVITLPFIYILFVEGYRHPNLYQYRRSFAGFFVIFWFSFISFVRILIPGNDYFTAEGSRYALNMFASKYKCVVEFQDRDMNLVDGLKKFGTGSMIFTKFPGTFCSPWETLYLAWSECVDERPRSLKITLYSKYFSHVMVDEKNLCNLQYKPFSKNSWVHDSTYDQAFNKSVMNPRELWFFERKDIFFNIYYVIFYMIAFLIIWNTFFKHKKDQ
jgi:hypothetical protein